MAKIILKKSSVAQKVPVTGDLDYGELALNYTDGKLYYKTSSNSIAELGGVVSNALTIGTGLSGTSYNGSLPVTIQLATNYGDTVNPYGSKTAAYVLASPTNTSGQPSFRALEVSDIPTLNQNTTGTASNVTGTVAIANGGTGQTTATNAFNALSPVNTKGDLLVHNGTNNIRLAVGVNGYVLTADSSEPSGVKWAAGGGGGSLTIKEINSGGDVETVNNVNTIKFDQDGGFDVVDLGSGQVKITMNSTFKTWQVQGQTSLVASGLDTVKFVAGTGITITTNASASPKEIGFEINTASIATLTGTQTLTNKTLGATTISGHLIPSADVTYDLGSSTYKFRDLYLSGSTINLGASTITAVGNTISLPAGTTIGGINVGTLTLKGSVVAVANLPSQNNTLGDAFVVTEFNPDRLYFWDNNQWVNLGNFQGPQGETGPQGPQGPAGPTGTINDLSDVIITSPESGQVLKYNGTNWINAADAGGGGGSSGFLLADLGSVTESPSSGSTFSILHNLDVGSNLTVTGNTTISGNLTVNGTTTTLNSTTLSVDDKNIILADTATPTNLLADGGGITLKGTTDKTILWSNTTGYWTLNQPVQANSLENTPVGAETPNTGIFTQLTATSGITLKANTTTISDCAVSTTQLSTTSVTTLDQWSISSYRTAKYLVQVTQGTNYQTSEILVIHDGTTTYRTEYAVLETNGTICALTTDISSGLVRLRAELSTASQATIRVERIRIVV